MICVGFEGLTVPDTLRELIDRGVSSVILFTRNYESPAQLASLCTEIKACARPHRPIMICIDQEGGRVQRLREPFTIVPSMREVGACQPIEVAEQIAHNIGCVQARELRAVNIDMNLAPVLDVDSNPANPVIGERSFGADPQLVARLGCAMIKGLQWSDFDSSKESGVAACGKHFPGHGDTQVDSHLDLPRLRHQMSRLEQVELPPFAAAIKTGVAAIMTAHVIFESLDDKHPATMSLPVIDGLLRRRFGFDRVVISDDLEMKAIIDHFGIDAAIIQGAAAGIDLFMVCHQPQRQHQAIDVLIAAAQTNSESRKRIYANHRLDRLFDQFVQPARRFTKKIAARIGCAEHRALIAPPPLAAASHPD